MNFKQLLRGGIFAGIFIIPLIPLYVAESMFFPFITGKNFAFRIIVEFVFALWLILVLLDRSYAPRRSLLLIASGCFLGVITLADIFGVSPYKSFWSNYERMEGLISHIHFFAYFLVAGSVLNTEKLWNNFLKTSLAVSAAMGVYGLAQLGGLIQINQGGVRLDGTFGNASYLAVYMVFHIFIAAYFLVQEWDRRNSFMRYAYLAIIALELYILYFTATRGAILGLFAGALLSGGLIGVFGTDDRKVRRAAIGIIAGIAVLIGGFFLARNTEFVRESPVLSRFASISLEETTTQSRFMIWSMAWEGAKERPLLGWGQENFNYVFNKYYDPRMYNQEQWFDRTHNIIFDWLIAGGFLGLAAYLFLFGAAAFALWRSERFSFAEKSIFTGMLAAYLVHNLFVFDNLVSYIVFFSFAAFFHAMNVSERRGGSNLLEYDAIKYGAVPVIGIALLASLYVFNVKPILANTSLIEALRAQDAAAALSGYKQVFELNTFGSTEARERLWSAAGTFTAAPENVRNDYVQLARDEAAKQLLRTPGDSRILLFVGALYGRLGQFGEAERYLLEAVKYSPKKQTILLEAGSVYLETKQFDKALALFKEALDLEPANMDARIVYGIGALYAGDKALSNEILSEVPLERRAQDQRLISVYSDLNANAELIELLNERVRLDPGSMQNRLSLAAGYLKIGEREKSIRVLEEIKALDARYADQINRYISEIRAGRNPSE